MEKYPKYREELVRGGVALFTTTLALATIVVVIYAWVSGSKEAEELLKILASFVALGAMLIALLTFYIEKSNKRFINIILFLHLSLLNKIRPKR